MADFFIATKDAGTKLFKAGLTAAEWRLWYYFSLLDPFGDKYRQMPDLLIIMQETGVKKTTFYAAIAKFQKHEIFDFQAKEVSLRKIDGSRNLQITLFPDNPTDEGDIFPEKRTECSEKRTEFQKNEPEIKKAEKREPKPAPVKRSVSPHTIQTKKDIKDTTESAAGANQEGSVFEIFLKYSEPLRYVGVHLKTYQNEMLQLNPRVEEIIQQAGCLPINRVEPAIRAFLGWARNAKDVKDIYRAFKSAITRQWEES